MHNFFPELIIPFNRLEVTDRVNADLQKVIKKVLLADSNDMNIGETGRPTVGQVMYHNGHEL